MYKSISFFTVEGFNLSTFDFNDVLEPFRYREIQPSQETSVGWFSPYGDDMAEDSLVRSVMNNHAICFKVTEKKIRKAVIDEQIRVRFNELKKSPMGPQKLDKHTRKDLTESIKNELLPKEYPVSKKINAYIDTENNYLVIEGASANSSEAIINMLKRGFDAKGLEVEFNNVQTNHNPTGVITNWVKDGDVVPDDVSLGSKCSLSGLEGQVIKYNRHELSEEKLIQYIANDGMDVADLEAQYKDEVAFTLSGDMSIRGIKLLDGTDKMFDDADQEDQWDADFIVMVNVYGQLIGNVIEWMGGLAE